MATTKQKEAARRNIKKARQVQVARAHGVKIPRRAQGMSTAEENRLSETKFAFPKERKEPIRRGTACRMRPGESKRSLTHP